MKNIKETKEKILKELKGKRILKCPFCNHDKFLRSAIEEPCLVEIYDDEGSIGDEDIGMCVTEYAYKCAKCGKDVIVEELK